MNDWIDVNDRLPDSDKIWIEVKHIYIDEIEWFYWTKYDKWPNGKITHWRYITHSIFSPIAEQSYILELH